MTRVIIAGGGIGGLSAALTLNQIGVDCTVYEAVSELKPLGVGINLQPNAVRELFDLGIAADKLDQVGLPAREWALVGLNGNDIYAEPRGLEAGYYWPQYAVHRGKFHMLLHAEFVARAGEQAFVPGHKSTGYRNNADRTVTVFFDGPDGPAEDTADLLIVAEGIHSACRAQMHPDQPPIHWGGALMWRGVTRAKPIRTGSSFVGLGTHRHRMVIYPISHPDENGECLINWIAEYTLDEADWSKTGWFRKAEVDDFAHLFDGFKYDWLDVPDLLHRAEVCYENPMIDREPIPTWIDGSVALMGDAAHAMYPTGSNGASQAVIDARVLGQCMLAHGVTRDALKAYDDKLCEPVSALILRNRGAGPFGLLNMVDERSGGEFDDIDDVIPPEERAAFMANYKAAAGFAIETLNAAPDMIPQGAKVEVAETA